MTSKLQQRVDPVLYKDVENILEAQGIRVSQAVLMFFSEIRRCGGFPFLPTRVPNAELAGDLRKAGKKAGIKTYKNKKEFFASLDELN